MDKNPPLDDAEKKKAPKLAAIGRRAALTYFTYPDDTAGHLLSTLATVDTDDEPEGDMALPMPIRNRRGEVKPREDEEEKEVPSAPPPTPNVTQKQTLHFNTLEELANFRFRDYFAVKKNAQPQAQGSVEEQKKPNKQDVKKNQ